MISTKVGTQSWSKAAQQSGLEVDKTNYVAATKAAPIGQSEDKTGSEKVNELLNPLSSQKPIRKPNNEMGKDDFLKLMMAQIKHQDPTNPLQSHEMAAQLAQFTSLEQLFNVNKNLETISKGQEPMQRYEVLNFLGKSIKADSKEIFWGQGDKSADLRFDLKADVSKAKVTIIDPNGDEIRTIDMGQMKKGLNKVVWNGRDSKDQQARPGQYTFRVEAENTSGRKVGVTTETSGTITGVNFTSEGPLLMVGDQKVRLQDVHKIEDESQKEKNDKEVNVVTPEAAPQAAAPLVKEEAKPEVKVAGTKIPVDSSKGTVGEWKVGGGPFGHR